MMDLKDIMSCYCTGGFTSFNFDIVVSKWRRSFLSKATTYRQFLDDLAYYRSREDEVILLLMDFVRKTKNPILKDEDMSVALYLNRFKPRCIEFFSEKYTRYGSCFRDSGIISSWLLKACMLASINNDVYGEDINVSMRAIKCITPIMDGLTNNDDKPAVIESLCLGDVQLAAKCVAELYVLSYYVDDYNFPLDFYNILDICLDDMSNWKYGNCMYGPHIITFAVMAAHRKSKATRWKQWKKYTKGEYNHYTSYISYFLIDVCGNFDDLIEMMKLYVDGSDSQLLRGVIRYDIPYDKMKKRRKRIETETIWRNADEGKKLWIELMKVYDTNHNMM